MAMFKVNPSLYNRSSFVNHRDICSVTGAVYKRTNRNSKWEALRKYVLSLYPQCAICGSKSNLHLHHILPVNLYPEHKYNQNNLIVLCNGKNNCHFIHGHLSNWNNYNPNLLVLFDRKV